jgi:hypothetical protein
MAKLPYMQFYPADYQADVRCLSMATRGAWMEILCVLWRSAKRGQRTLNLEEWGRELGCSASEVSLYLTDLAHHKVGKISREIIENVEQITISSKRIMREKMKQMLAVKRKQKQRDMSMSRTCHAIVTPMSQQSHAEESEIRIRNQKSYSEEEKSRPLRATCDEAFWESLKVNPAYRHINFEVERGKMDAWFALPKNKQRKLTRPFVLNWLNKIDPPLAPVLKPFTGHTKVCL